MADTTSLPGMPPLIAGVVRIFEDVQYAREHLIGRPALEAGDLPESIKRSIREQWGEDLSAEQLVDRILDLVRTGGDEQVLELAHRIDGVSLHSLEVSRDEIDAALREIPGAVLESMQFAASRVRAFHEKQAQHGWMDFEEGYGQIVRPLDTVGLYAPGGTALYPSTVIMTAVPAKVAGVRQVLLTSPANKDGNVPIVTLAAAAVSGVDRVFRIGGAAAIGAFAYGTASVPRVDKILGPGNLFVALAKRKVYGQVAIDSIAGPTETLIVADATADAAHCAADMLAQAEHDVLAQPILITTSVELAHAVAEQIAVQLPRLERERIARASVANRGGIVVAPNLDVAFDLANEYAPEHLCMLIEDPWSRVKDVRNAGGVFVGEYATEALGDYVAGPSHVMPTGGTARFSSPLNLDDFVKKLSVIGVREDQQSTLVPHAVRLARAEGLTGHARSAAGRLKD